MSEAIREELEEEEEIRDQFDIDTDQKAEWALNKIREAKADRDRWVEFYKGQIEKVKDQCDNRIANLEFMLRKYFMTGDLMLKETKTQKSYQLPSGKLVLKKQGPEFDHDDAKLVPWLEENAPSMVKVEKSSKWGDFKKMVTIFNGNVIDMNGEVVPGVTVTERDEKFVVEVK